MEEIEEHLQSTFEECHGNELEQLHTQYEQQLEEKEQNFAGGLSATQLKYEEQISSKLKATTKSDHLDRSEGDSQGSTPRMGSVASVTPPGELSERDVTTLAEELRKEVEVEELQHELELYRMQMDNYEREMEKKHSAELESVKMALQEEFLKERETLNAQHSLEAQELEKQLNELRHRLTNVEDVVPMAVVPENEQGAVMAVCAPEHGVVVKDTELDNLRKVQDEDSKELEQLKRELTEKHNQYVANLIDELGKEHADELNKVQAKFLEEKAEDEAKLRAELEENHTKQLEDLSSKLQVKSAEDVENLKNELSGKHDAEKMQMSEKFEERIEFELGKLREEMDGLMMRELEAAADHQKSELEAELAAKWEEWKLQYSEKVDSEKAWMRQEHAARITELEAELKEQQEAAESMQKMHKEELESQREALEKQFEAEKQEISVQSTESSEYRILNEKTIADYESKIRELEDKACQEEEHNRAELNRLQAERDEFSSKVDLCELEIKELEESLKLREEAFQKHISEMDKLKILLDLAENTHKELEEERKNKISELEAKVTAYQTRAQENESNPDNITEENIFELQATIHELEIKLEESDNALAKMSKQWGEESTERESEQRQTILHLENEIRELGVSIQDYENKEAVYKMQEEQYESRIRDLESDAQSKSAQLEAEDSVEKDISEVEQLQQKLRDVTAELQTLRQGELDAPFICCSWQLYLSYAKTAYLSPKARNFNVSWSSLP